MANVITHVGLCVEDLDRARGFYEALGFAFQRELQPPEELTGTLLEIASPHVTAVYLTLGDFVLELLRFDRPDNPPFSKRVMNEPGLTHLSLASDDVAETLDQVRANGGQVLENTNVGPAVLVRDPDGQLIEIVQARPKR
jgi:lactoylglutathione lyase